MELFDRIKEAAAGFVTKVAGHGETRRAGTTGSAAAACVDSVAGAPSRMRAIMVAIISTRSISSVAMSMIRSLYLPSIRRFQPWKRYCMVAVISPYAPPSNSCSLRA